MDRQQINRFKRSSSIGAHASSLRVNSEKNTNQKQMLRKSRLWSGKIAGLPQLVRFSRYGRLGKSLYVASAFLIFCTAAFPVVEIWYEKRAFRLSEKANALLDIPSKKLAEKITYNKEKQTYHFNEKQKSVETPTAGSDPSQVPSSELQSQLTGKDGSEKPLYSVDMPEQIEDGFTYYDNNLKLSFKMVPQGQTGKGVLIDDRLVYNVSNDTKAVFTVKNNGIKEDVILQKKPNYDELSLDYTLELPDTLEARLLEDGSLGIYSADPSLFGSISFGSDADREKVENARINGEKNYEVFNIPAPVIKQTGGGQSNNAKFLLAGDTLKVYVSNLDALQYPIAIDPSVIVTSTSDFIQGNNEDNIEYGTNEIRRPSVTGGQLGTFTASSAMNLTRTPMNGAVYNGYLYAFGDWTSNRTSIEYAQIQPDGSIGAWTLQSNAMPQNRYGFGLTIYNGYAYIVCGNNGSDQQNTYYGKINSDGSINVASWTLSPNIITGPRYWNSAAAYDGYLYSSGGHLEPSGNDVNSWNQVWVTKINGDGSIGAWSQTQAMPTNRALHAMNAYNGYMYIAGGQYWDNSPIGPATDVYPNNIIYAKINTDGTLGSWQVATTIVSGTVHRDIVIYGGYAYYTTPGPSMYYAAILPNGSFGTPRTTNPPGGHAVNSAGIVAYNGKIYRYGGGSGGSDTTQASYASIMPGGYTSSYGAGGALSSRTGVASVAHNGYIYAIGGHDGTNPLTSVTRALVGSDGVIGTWSTTGITQLTTARSYAAAAVYNGYLYVSGGLNNASATINDVQYLSLANLAGAWASATPGTARYKHAMVTYSGYLYIVGGDTAGPPGVAVVNTTRRATINLTNGSLGSWVDGTSFTTERRGMGVAMLGNRIFMTGGYKNEIVGGTLFAEVQYADIDPATGNMSAWTTLGSGNNLATAKSGIALASYNGCIYAVGGLTDQSSEVSTNNFSTTVVEYACMQSDGTLSTWSTNTPLAVARAYMGVAVVDGVLALAGGSSHGITTSPPNLGSTSAEIHNGGSGVVGTASLSPNTFTTARWQQATAAYNGYLYIAGGNTGTGTATDTVSKAPINSDGSIGAWVAQTSTSTGAGGQVLGAAMLAYNGFMYLVGGNWNSSNALVYNISIDPVSGDLGASWVAQPSLNTQRYYHGIALYNGYIYALGGIQQQTGVLPATYALTDTVEYTEINDNGALGAWSYTTSFGTAKAQLSVASANGHLYFTGGVSGTTLNTDHRDAFVAKINSDGTIGSWSQTASLPFLHVTTSQLEPYGGHMYYAYGGIMYRATILANGHLADWRPMSNTHASRVYGGLVAYKGYLYLVAGGDGSNRQNNVQIMNVSTIERKSLYSKMIDLGASADVSSIAYNTSSLPLNDHKHSVVFQTAAAGAPFGTKRYADSIPAYVQVGCVLLQSIRYVQLSIILEDSRNAAYPDVSTTSRQNLTDVTISYVTNPRPDPNERLFQGKYFRDSTLKPYDTCQ